MLSTSQSYKLITKDLTQTLNTTAAKATVKRESKYYLDNIGKVKSIDDFISNKRLFTYAMKAFGLSDMTYAKALVKKALTEGVENNASFANRLVDPRLREFATTFNFQRRGEYTTTFVETKQGTVDRYVRQTLEEDVGASNEGVRLALYFERKAPTISSALGLLADKALLSVVQTALDIPASSAYQDIDKQAAAIESRLPISTFKDPAKLKAFLEKFTIKWELANPTTSSTVASPLLSSAASGNGVASSVLAALQNLKIGGR